MSIIKRQTIIGTIYSYLGIIIGTLTQAYLIPNYFSIEENGLIQLITRWMGTIIMFTGLGYSSAGVRFFRYFRSNENKHNGYLFNALILFAIGTALSIVFLYYFKDNILSSNKGDNTLFINYFYLIIPISIASGLFIIFDNYSKMLYDTVMSNFLNQFLLRFLAFSSISLFAGKWINFHQFIILWSIAMCFPTVIMIWHCYRLGNFSLKWSPFLRGANFKKEFINFALFSLITGLTNVIITNLDSFMVYQNLGLGKTGIYNTCLFFGSIMTMSYVISIKASTAIVIDAIENNEKDKLQKIFQKSSVTQLIFGSLIFIVAVASIDNAFLLIKPEYSIGKPIIIIIGLAKLYDLASGVNSLILSYSKYYKLDTLLVISFVGLLYVLNYYLIPKYDLLGAAASTLIAIVYYNTVRNLFIWKFFKIHPYTSAQLKIVLLGICVLLLGIYLPNFSNSRFITLSSIMYKSIILSVIYIIVIYKLNISPEINQVIQTLLKKIKVFSK